MASARPPLASRRGIAGALTLLVGLLNIAVAPGRSHDWFAEGLAIGVVGGLLVALAGAVTLRSEPAFAFATAMVNLIVVAANLVVVMWGYPFGPWQSFTPAFEPYRVIIVVAAATAGVIALTCRHTAQPAGAVFENLAPLLVAVVAVPGLYVSSWGDDARHMLGAGHVHAASVTVTLTPEQQTLLDDELRQAAEVAGRLPSLADALDAGWVVSGPVVEGAGQMVVRPDVDLREIDFDIETPLGYLYADDSADAPVVGLEYAQWMPHGDTPTGFTGQTPMWHMHMLTCVVDDAYAVPQDDAVTGQSCAKVGGRINTSMSYMLRVWPLADHPNPDGYFAHQNPLVAG